MRNTEIKKLKLAKASSHLITNSLNNKVFKLFVRKYLQNPFKIGLKLTLQRMDLHRSQLLQSIFNTTSSKSIMQNITPHSFPLQKKKKKHVKRYDDELHLHKRTLKLLFSHPMNKQLKPASPSS
jgi:hypothetical protein